MRYLTITLFFVLLIATSINAQVVLFNDDFEAYEPNTLISNEGYVVQNSIITVVQDEGANSGEKYLKSDALKNDLYFKREFSLEAGKTYEWSIATKIDNGIKHRIKVVSLSGHEYGLLEPTNSSWQTHTLKFMVLAGEEKVYLQVYRWAKASISFDDFILSDTEETAPTASATKLPAVFGDNMVLQRSSTVKVWGTDKPNTQVKVSGSWGESSTAISDENGNWLVNLNTPEAGGPFELQVNGTDELIFSNIMSGEVWLAAGQSNMQRTLNQSQTENGAIEAIANSANSNIRYFGVGRDASFEPQDELSGMWQVSDPAVSAGFSAVSYFFAEMLQDSLQIPIGVICSAYGAAKIEAFIDKETIESLNFLTIPNEMLDPVQKTPTVLYNTMIHPLLGYRIKGALWYQGEGNRASPDEYAQLLPSMVDSWRTKFELGNFPFYFVQIAPFNTTADSPAFWEMQLNASYTIENAGLVSTLDIGDCSNVHPLEKKKVGQRLAMWALANNYGFDKIAHKIPICTGFDTVENGLKLHFENIGSGLKLLSNETSQFEIAGSDGVYYPAKARLDADNIIYVNNEAVISPVKVRYLFGNCLNPTLFTNDGLPVYLFEIENASTTSTSKSFSNEKMSLYPNPVKDILNLNFKKKTASFCIINASGQTIMKVENSKTIDVSYLKPGIYFLQQGINNIKFIKE